MHNISTTCIISGFALLGQALHNSSAPEYKPYLSASSDPSVADGFMSALEGLKSSVSGPLAWTDGEAIPLRWGEVIPLSFLQHGLLNEASHPRGGLVNADSTVRD